MDEKEVSCSCAAIAEEKELSVYPIYFGVSCAFVAIQLLAEKDGNLVGGNWSAIAETMLQGSAQLLGLLVWKAQGGEDIEERSELVGQLRKAELEVADLRRRRYEDSRANEKVVSIFNTQEQNWICERKRLRLQIQALANELRLVDAKNKQLLSSLNRKINEKDGLIESREKDLEEEEGKRRELEERLQLTEMAVEEMREGMKKESQERSADIWKHKTAFIELVSNQRRLEAEMGRALGEAEAARQELEEVLEQKEESVEMVKNLSVEMDKLQKDAEQKERILSAMLRKSKLDTSEKEILLKEVKISKARRKHAELETERWKIHCEPRNGRKLKETWGGRDSFSSENSMDTSGLNSAESGSSQSRNGLITKALVLGSFGAEYRKNFGSNILKRASGRSLDCYSRYSAEENGEIAVTADAKKLEDWVRSEAEKYTSMIEQRHYSEIDAFAEQMRLKDEKLEACRWQLLSMELESKRLESHAEEMNKTLSHLREENIKLEALLMDKDQELKSLQEKFSLHIQICKKSNLNPEAKFRLVDPVALWSEVKIIKKKSKDNNGEQKANIENDLVDKELVSGCNLRAQSTSSFLPYVQSNDSTVVEICEETMKELGHLEKSCEIHSHEAVLMAQAPEEEIEEEKEIILEPCHVQGESPNNSREEVEIALKLPLEGNCLKKKYSPVKMDLHALGVSYKIKRLKQQLLLLEKIIGNHVHKKPTNEDGMTNERPKIDEQQGQQFKEFFLFISLLSKQVKRYQTLEEKVDGLCQRMQENGREIRSRDSDNSQAKKEIETLEHFLEETFQLQRYMVATGQKLMEIQYKIAGSSFLGGFEGIKECEGFDVRQFADNIRKLFGDVQRGLEIRISRIIGDLEGTLACEGILHLKN